MTISASTRTRVVVLLTSIALALGLLLVFAVTARADDAAGVVAGADYLTYTVQSGDTLWDIATTHTPKGEDVRVVVADIRVANDLGSSVIVPGQVLRIPAVPPGS
jgi:LysM repeat protein